MREIFVDAVLAISLLAATVTLSFLLATVLIGWEFTSWFIGLPNIEFWVFCFLLTLIVLTLFITNL